MKRLLLGPIVGHTDEQSTRIWIQVDDDPGLYWLRVIGAGSVPFVSTEADPIEFGTAIAIVQGLRPDRQYRYQILRRGRVVPGASGSFRTMPPPGSMAVVQFVAISCNHQEELGAWERLERHIDDSKPRFLLMMGDQVYVDQNGDVWQSHLDRPASERRRALAQKYHDNWSRQPLRRIMANIPTYMMWDDHEIRDGWGSWAPDSPTMAARYPRGAKIFAQYDAYFQDARDVYWHFQMCHNPVTGINTTRQPLPPEANTIGLPPEEGLRRAMPFVFRCGRLAVLMADSRGARDLWREEYPVLGAEQWQFIDDFCANLDPEIEALAIVTPAPIANMSPRSAGQVAAGHLQPDVRFFRRGDAKRLSDLINSGGTSLSGEGRLAEAINKVLDKSVHKVRGKIDEVRDQWSHHLSRPEQVKLIRKASEARNKNRPHGSPRGLMFLGGDIHLGGIFDITVSDPGFTMPCLVSSGISQLASNRIDTIVTVDESFEVASGIKSVQRNLVQAYNFGVVQIVPTGSTPRIVSVVVHEGASTAIVAQAGI